MLKPINSSQGAGLKELELVYDLPSRGAILTSTSKPYVKGKEVIANRDLNNPGMRR